MGRDEERERYCDGASEGGRKFGVEGLQGRHGREIGREREGGR